MANLAGTPKKVVIRTSRDTLGLVVAATAMTFALSYVVHSKHDAAVLASASAPGPAATLQSQDASAQPKQDWAGHLADLSAAPAPATGEPMTSASLTVPKSQLALPAVPKPVIKPRPCPEAPCVAKPASAAAAKRQVASAGELPKHEQNNSLIGLLNPLNHLPDMSAVGRPFTYAGGAVTGWFKRL